MEQTIAAPSLPEKTDNPQVEFSGRRGALAKLIFKNILLNIVTIGIYRFWGKTRVRRYFWGNIVIRGEPLEYVGRGLELFIGFLIILAVLVPLSLAGTGLRYLFQGQSLWMGMVIDGLYFAVFLFLVQFALYRMWRYRLTRTVWRGIRFGLDGKALPYAVRAFAWWVAQILTLGLAHPWASVDLMRYKLSRVRFGDTRFAFAGSGKALFVPWLIAWVVPGCLMIYGFVTFQVAIFETVQDMAQGTQIGQPPKMDIPSQAGLFPFGMVLFYFTFVWYRIREFRYLVSCLGFGQAAFQSGAKVSRVFLAFLVAFVMTILFFVLIAVMVVVVVFAIKIVGSGSSVLEAFLSLLFILAFLAVLIFSPIVNYVVVVFTIVRHIWTTLKVTDPQVFDAAIQATGEGPKFGEGLADALDVGAV